MALNWRLGRFSALGEPLAEAKGTLTHLFPSPEKLAQADLRGHGLTQARENALRALARAVAEKDLVLDRSADRELTRAKLLHLPGVGPWTASYIAMRALGDPDALPVSDRGLRRAFEQRGLTTDPKGMLARAERWRPWRAYAAHYLWASPAPFREPQDQRTDEKKNTP